MRGARVGPVARVRNNAIGEWNGRMRIVLDVAGAIPFIHHRRVRRNAKLDQKIRDRAKEWQIGEEAVLDERREPCSPVRSRLGQSSIVILPSPTGTVVSQMI